MIGRARDREDGMELRGRKVIALGERDGVPGPALAECATRAGAEVVLTLTACYV
jgi:glycine/sarcosine/betaine reductase complex component A